MTLSLLIFVVIHIIYQLYRDSFASVTSGIFVKGIVSAIKIAGNTMFHYAQAALNVSLSLSLFIFLFFCGVVVSVNSVVLE